MFNECFWRSWSFFLLETPCHPTTPCSTKRCTCWPYLLVVNIHKCHNYSNHSVPCALDNGHCYFLASQGFIKILIKTNKKNWNISIFVLWRSCLSCQQHLTGYQGEKTHDVSSARSTRWYTSIQTILVTCHFFKLGAWHAAKTRTCLLRFSALKAQGSMLADLRLSSATDHFHILSIGLELVFKWG